MRAQDDRRKRNTYYLTLGVIGVVIVFMMVSSHENGPTTKSPGYVGGGLGGVTLLPEEAAFQPTAPNTPHGGVIKDLVLTGAALDALKAEAVSLPSLQLNDRQLCDIETLLCGAFSPLDGYNTQSEFAAIVNTMRLPNGLVWPMPITLDVNKDDKTMPPETKAALRAGGKIALRDAYYNLIAVLDIKDVYTPDKAVECQMVFGTTDLAHPGVDYVMNKAGPQYVGGSLRGVQLPSHYDFKDLRRTPKELREVFRQLGWTKIVAFQTRNPMHRAHIELTRQAAALTGAKVLIQPVVGMTQPGDIDYSTRVRCYKAILPKYYEPGTAIISLYPLAMRMAGPREALWHALIRKNYGASHFVIGRDHAGCKNADGDDFYGPLDAQNLVKQFTNEIGVRVVTFDKLVYVEEADQYFVEELLPAQYAGKGKSISGTEVRRRLATGEEIPAWFSDPAVVALLRTVYPPMTKRGFTLFFTGLSGSGKTTVAHALIPVLNEIGTRKLTLLDGDVTRTFLTKDLGFTPEDRNTNILRLGYVASEITKYGGIAVISAIAPYPESRNMVRELVESNGGFVEIYMSTSVADCAKRDPKGLYKKAFAGLLPGFTGVDPNAPYYPPTNPEININGADHSVVESVEIILTKLVEFGYLEKSVLDRQM